jgi:hypothetical protein
MLFTAQSNIPRQKQFQKRATDQEPHVLPRNSMQYDLLHATPRQHISDTSRSYTMFLVVKERKNVSDPIELPLVVKHEGDFHI